MNVDIVVPTVGRPSLALLLRGLDDAARCCDGLRRARVVVVDDRTDRSAPLPLPGVGNLERVELLATAKPAGPAAARNVGWRNSRAEWIAFLDDDVVPALDWFDRLSDDLQAANSSDRVGASQGRIVVPLPAGRRPTNWEREVAGLSTATFVTADMAYRRAALEHAGGFDEHFVLAYREDSDLALRIRAAGYAIVRGRRTVEHPAQPAPWNVSVRRQLGNAADARMRAKHGPHWRRHAVAPRGRLPLHAITTAALAAAAAGTLTRTRPIRTIGLLTWVGLTLQFAFVRIRRGPWRTDEIARIIATSVLIPPAAVWHRMVGEVRERRRVRGALLDRDGTLVVDVPYNGDPDRVEPVPGAPAALARLRAHGVRIAVVSNQSGVARGLLDEKAVQRVNARIDVLLGPIERWFYCPHGEQDGCECRKPRPGMIRAAARAIGVPLRRCVVIGDTQADIDAAAAAGCRAILVPNPRTRAIEVRAANLVAPDLDSAVDLLLGTIR